MPSASRMKDPDAVRMAKRAIVKGQGYEQAASILNVSVTYVKMKARIGFLPRSKRKGCCRKGAVDLVEVYASFERGESSESISRRLGKSSSFIRALRKGKTWPPIFGASTPSQWASPSAPPNCPPTRTTPAVTEVA